MSEWNSPGDPPPWFRTDGSAAGTSNSLRPIKEVERQHEGFRERSAQVLGKDKPPKRVQTKQELFDQIRSLEPEALGEKAIFEFTEASRQLSSYTKERTSGSKKFTSQAQQFVTEFTNFVGAYSGIVSLVKNAGAPYGEAAYETLSLLLSVVVNKSKNDKAFIDLIRDLTPAFPRLDILSSVYPSARLADCVAAVYVEVIVFAREAVEYFAKFKTRLAKALTSPPSLGIELKAKIIKEKLAEVSKEAMVQLHARSLEIHQGVSRVEAQNTELKVQLDELKQQNESLEVQLTAVREQNTDLKAALNDLQQQTSLQAERDKQERLLHLMSGFGFAEQPDTWPETNLESVSKTLESVFPGVRGGSSSPFLHAKHHAHRFHDMGLGTIRSDTELVKWHRLSTSSLLFVCGRTEREARTNIQSTCSWLSPAAVHIAKEIACTVAVPVLITSEVHKIPLAQPDDLCIFYSCHPGLYSNGRADHDPRKLLSFIAWKLCEWPAASTLQHVEEFKSRAERLNKEYQNLKVTIAGMTALLTDILEAVASRNSTVWIMLDRVDECDLKLRDVMAQLIRLLHAQGPRVKILAVADAGYKGSKWDADDLDKIDEPLVFFRDQWDQQRMTSFERHSQNMLNPNGGPH